MATDRTHNLLLEFIQFDDTGLPTVFNSEPVTVTAPTELDARADIMKQVHEINPELKVIIRSVEDER